MTLKELKESINNHKLPSKLHFIFICKENNFLANQYIERICKLDNKKINKILTLMDLKTNDDILYLFEIDKLKIDDIPPIVCNYAIICKEVVGDLDYRCIEVPDVEKWQLESYVEHYIPNLDNKSIANLCNYLSYDVYKVDSIITKLSLLPKENQQEFLKHIREDKLYQGSLDIFKVTDIYVDKNLTSIKYLLNKEFKWSMDGFFNILKKQFKDVIEIQTKPQNTADSLNMSINQYNYIKKYKINKYTDKQLSFIYNLITECQSLLKNDILKDSNILSYFSLKFIEGMGGE